MPRITILITFLTLIVIVLNLRGSQDLPVNKDFFNLKKYEDNYKSELASQNPLEKSEEKMGQHGDHSEEEDAEKVDTPKYTVTKEAEFKDGAHIIKMLNKGANGEKMVFEPTFLQIKPGEKVRFIPVDKGHMAQTVKGGIPSGAAAFASKVNETYTQVFDQAGAYAVKCKPHYTMGMVAMIVVGDAQNIDQMEKLKIKGKKGLVRWEAMLEELRKL